MPRLGKLPLVVLVAVASATMGQEPAAVVLPGPPAVAIGSEWENAPVNPLAFNAYPAIGCDNWDCCHQWWCETWYSQVELLTLARTHQPQERVLIQTGAGAPVLTTNDLGFGLAPGVSTMLGHRLDGQTAIELTYFGANQWNTERQISRTGDLSLPGQLGVNLNDFHLANVMEVSLRSQWHNVEINYFHDLQRVSLLAGFRYLNWQEQLLIHATDSDLDQSNYQVRLSNNLVGGQIGARMASYYRGLDLESTYKAGLFGNEATQAQRVTDLNGTSVIRNVAATNGTVAFVSDLNLSASCPLSRSWRLRGGYNMFYLSSIALAANQLDFSNQSGSGRRVRADSGVLLYGFHVGLEALW
jgi:hypothetical protein